MSLSGAAQTPDKGLEEREGDGAGGRPSPINSIESFWGAITSCPVYTVCPLDLFSGFVAGSGRMAKLKFIFGRLVFAKGPWDPQDSYLLRIRISTIPRAERTRTRTRDRS